MAAPPLSLLSTCQRGLRSSLRRRAASSVDSFGAPLTVAPSLLHAAAFHYSPVEQPSTDRDYRQFCPPASITARFRWPSHHEPAAASSSCRVQPTDEGHVVLKRKVVAHIRGQEEQEAAVEAAANVVSLAVQLRTTCVGHLTSRFTGFHSNGRSRSTDCESRHRCQAARASSAAERLQG